MPENYSDTPLLLHLKLREIEIIVLYVRNKFFSKHFFLTIKHSYYIFCVLSVTLSQAMLTRCYNEN